jgi:hypothetical protein
MASYNDIPLALLRQDFVVEQEDEEEVKRLMRVSSRGKSKEEEQLTRRGSNLISIAEEC